MPKIAPRYLTKSRFKTACECPTKLYYIGKKDYANTKLDDDFLKALAEGGFQVGALAQAYFPGGEEIETLDYEEALSRTAALLKSENAIIFEAAFCFGNLFVRADIVEKRGDVLNVYEVKAKSFDPEEESPFFDKRLMKKGVLKLTSKWKPYLLDVAFQTFVIKNSYPKLKVNPYLYLTDKSSTASVDGLNQKFLLTQDESGRTQVRTKGELNDAALGTKILVTVSVSQEVEHILAATDYSLEASVDEGSLKFAELVSRLSDAYKDDRKLLTRISPECKGCEFQADEKVELKSGFVECWSAKLGKKDIAQPVFDIWNFRKSDKLMEEGRFFIRDVAKEDIAPSARKDGSPGLSQSERQWMQVEKVIKNDSAPYVDRDGLSAQMRTWKFPLHFIDFETTRVAVPFNKGRRPYEQIAFQFSHHIIYEDGRIEHAGEYINRERGKFPNFDFVRSLKHELEKDNGTIFRYAAHENTVLCEIYSQLRATSKSEAPDKDELCAWVKTVTTSSENATEEWDGERSMVDLCELVKRYYYHPITNGSNSIKAVLPAILKHSGFLRAKYSKPIYGSKMGPGSRNYSDWTWIQIDDSGEVKNPYKLLPRIFDEYDLETLDRLVQANDLADGGAAMTAYAKMQFCEMSETETNRVCAALLKYCELDTFAMVMMYEYWQDLVATGQKKRAA